MQITLSCARDAVDRLACRGAAASEGLTLGEPQLVPDDRPTAGPGTSGILLIHPVTCWVSQPPPFPDLGLGYLAAVLISQGHHVRLRDWNTDPSPEALEKELRAFAPRVVGMKVFTKDVAAARKTAALVRAALPDTVMLLGGPHASCADPEELLGDFPQVDFALRMEGEESLPRLILELEACPAWRSDPAWPARAETIPGLVWRHGDVVRANPGQVIADLNGLPLPVWDLMDPATYAADLMLPGLKPGPAAPIITTRGCPGQCSFCSAFLVSGRRIRFRSPSEVVREIRLLHDRFGVSKFLFFDNCFTSSRRHITGICQGVLDAGLDIVWDCNCYENLNSLDRETVALMARAGCRMVHMGIESASPRVRQRTCMTASLEGYLGTARLLRSNGIGVGAWFILGFPGETLSDMWRTLRFALAMAPEVGSFTRCFPLPNSQVYQELKKSRAFSRLDWSTYRPDRDSLSTLPPLALGAALEASRFLLRVRQRLGRRSQAARDRDSRGRA